MNVDKIYAETIVNEYAPKETSKAKALKRLDRKAKKPAIIFGYVFGVVMMLIMGFGMSLSLWIIGDNEYCFIIGIIIEIIGFIGIGVNYPIYTVILNNSKRKYASEIVLLAKEISEED